MRQENSIKRALESGEPIVGPRTMTRSPMLVEVYGNLGFDFVWVDFEHGGANPCDASIIEHLSRAAESADIELLVRVPSGAPELIRKALDAGVRTILIPRVDDATQMYEAIRTSRFRYDERPGKRGAAACRASTYGGDYTSNYADVEDENVLVGCMLETKAALDNIEEIVQTPELGFAYLGPGDLSTELGHPIEKNHPDVEAAVRELKEACIDADVPVGMGFDSVQQAQRGIEAGYEIIRTPGEVSIARDELAGWQTVLEDSSS